MEAVFMSCKICLEEYQVDSKSALACGCTFCESCLSSFFISKTLNLSFNDEKKFKCPAGCSEVSLEPQTALELISDSTSKEALSEALLKVYLTNANDVRSCPGQGCKYSGILPKTACHGSLRCENCTIEWRDEALYYPLEGYARKLFNAPQLSSYLLSLIYKDALTEECPKCSIGIYKAGGCPHMTCTKCKYEFCWNCKHKHHGHNQDLCNVTIGVKLVLLFLLCWSIVSLTQTVEILTSTSIMVVELTVQILTFNAFIAFIVATSSALIFNFHLGMVIHGILALFLGGVIHFYGLFARCIFVVLAEAIAIGASFVLTLISNRWLVYVV